MCPMKYFLLLAVFLAPIFLVSHAATWTARFTPDVVTVEMQRDEEVRLQLSGLESIGVTEVVLKTAESHVAEVHKVIPGSEIVGGAWSGSFNVTGVFLGKTDLFAEITTTANDKESSDQKLTVTVIREDRVIDHVFTYVVAILVSILYVNFGAALDLKLLKTIVLRPVGPAIGVFGQFVVMPLLSFGLGKLIFPDSHAMQLGMFFTGVSPAGGASNVWTAILNGNINLSVLMTTISTLAAFGLMPMWIFTLGRTIFEQGELTVPYRRIGTFALALVVPLLAGLLIQKYLPRVTRILVLVLKPVSTLLILFIVVFAIVTNLYLFELFSWQIAVAGLGLPWLGFLLGFVLAKVFRQVPADALAIAVETGIQNTGISIFLLRFTLPQPEADLTTVAPVAVAIMTPLPLIVLYVILKVKERLNRNRREPIEDKDTADLSIDSQETLAQGQEGEKSRTDVP
ncbi:ileal sodium/bile acid cotransporter-like [Phlebotomus argentipes]|uniref:ileal sodium/bile acid cotransporter-like n=1 Tax=Phlebotomus argentipes TaxID=94469 RepID=UPI002892B7C8|nr:ileal sodium/bile acid cotransporter-like [Phlebotomus argentipes]XP_059618021.1 ileal sodium/bile acid cotransporter-like [Phlebotomus argentipes]